MPDMVFDNVTPLLVCRLARTVPTNKQNSMRDKN
jgi:hypothetical protein